MPEGIEGFELGIAGADRPEARRGKGQYVTFLDGQSEAVVTLRILSDDRYEIDESFELYLDKDIPDGNSEEPVRCILPGFASGLCTSSLHVFWVVTSRKCRSGRQFVA